MSTLEVEIPMKILVVDDERPLVKGIKFNLEHEGYEVDCCYDGASAVTMARNNTYGLIILDLMMPEKDGLQTCQEIRTFSSVPVIMLTARSESSDLLLGFESGADDYITKPFNILELKARIRALLRRSGISASVSAAASEDTDRLSFGHVTVDLSSRSVFVDEVATELTMKEYDLMLFLMKNPGKVYSRESLMNLVWSYDYIGDSRTVDVHIRRLREKLERKPAKPEMFLTKWGIGYYFKPLAPAD